MAKEGMKLTGLLRQFDRLHPFPIGTPDGLLRGPHRNGKERGLPCRQAGTEPEGNNHRRDPEEGGLRHRLLRQVAFGRSSGLHAAGSRIRRIRGHSLFQRHVGQRKPETKVPAPALDQGKQTGGPYPRPSQPSPDHRCHNGCRRSLHQPKQGQVFLPRLTPPFTPLHMVSPSRLAKAEGDAMRALVSEIDSSTGRILNALRKHKIDQNTLVLFTNDNGGAGKTRAAAPCGVISSAQSTKDTCG